MTTLTTIEAKQKELMEQTLDVFAQELKQFFEDNPDLDSIEILNPDSYNDEGYAWPGSRDYSNASMTTVINGTDVYWGREVMDEQLKNLAERIDRFIRSKDMFRVFRLFAIGSITAERFGDRVDMTFEEVPY